MSTTPIQETDQMLMTKLGARSRNDIPGNTVHKWILDKDYVGDWAARYAEVQAHMLDLGPIMVYARRGTHRVHLATALRALADHVEAEGMPRLRR